MAADAEPVPPGAPTSPPADPPPSAVHRAVPCAAPPAVPRPAVSFLAFDYGLKRTGVASGNLVAGMATPLTTVRAEGDARFEPIARLIAEWQPDALVVGVPFHPDGAEHDNTRRARRFARQLSGRFRLPVHEVDERYSTTEAHSSGASAAQADAAAAAILLQQYFNELAANELAANQLAMKEPR